MYNKLKYQNKIQHVNEHVLIIYYDVTGKKTYILTKLCEILTKIQINLNMNNILRVNNIITYKNIADTLKT